MRRFKPWIQTGRELRSRIRLLARVPATRNADCTLDASSMDSAIGFFWRGAYSNRV